MVLMSEFSYSAIAVISHTNITPSSLRLTSFLPSDANECSLVSLFHRLINFPKLAVAMLLPVGSNATSATP